MRYSHCSNCLGANSVEAGVFIGQHVRQRSPYPIAVQGEVNQQQSDNVELAGIGQPRLHRTLQVQQSG
jgi:hypothetical protein